MAFEARLAVQTFIRHLNFMVAMARNAFRKFSLFRYFRVDTFQEVLLFINVTLSACFADVPDTRRNSTMAAVAANTGRYRSILFLKKRSSMNAGTVGIKYIVGKVVLIHQFLVSMTLIACIRKIKRI